MERIFRRILSVLLAVIMLFGVGVIAGAETSETVEIIGEGYTDSGIEWSLDSEGHLRLSGKGGMFYAYPQRPNQVPWFLPHREDIKKVTIGYGITDIGQRAFYGCVNLESVSIPVSVTRINDRAFANCQNLNDIVLPSSVYRIGESAFSGCTNLSSIVIPHSVTSVGDFAFSKSGIKSLGICSEKAVLCEKAFYKCESLETVTMAVSPNSHNTAFDESFNIKSVNYTGTQEEWKALPFVSEGYNDFGLLDIKFNSECVRHVEKINVSYQPESVIYMYGEELDLTDFEISVLWSDGVTEIITDYSKLQVENFGSDDYFAVIYCNSFIDIPVEFKTEKELYPSGKCGGNLSWKYGVREKTLTISGTGVMSDYRGYNAPWYKYSDEAEALILEEGISRIGNYAFTGFDKITDIEFPDSLELIGTYAFENCENLKTVSFSSSVTTIRKNAFGNETPIESVYFEGTVEEWSEISISDYNDSILNADLYFNGELHSHSYSSAVTKEASCEKKGVLTYTCECTKSYTEEIPLAEHKTIVKTVPATCTAEGSEYDYCESCKQIIGKVTAIPVIAHTPGEWVGDGLGKIVKKCTVCGTVVEEAEVTVDKTPQPAESEVNYGNSIVLDSGFTGSLPEGAYIVWTASNENFDMEVSEDGRTCTITSVESGETTFSATVYGADGNVIEVTEQTVTSDAGFMAKIADIFDKIFGFIKGLFLFG